MSRVSVRALLLDDDKNVLAILHHYLREQVPELEVHLSTEPRIKDGYDIYLIDNDFGGRQVGAQLATEARRAAPDALIIAHSSKLDRTLLKRLINSNCDGAYDKDSAEERVEMLALIEVFAQERLRGLAGLGNGPASILREMAGLLGRWNERLGAEEQANSKKATGAVL